MLKTLIEYARPLHPVSKVCIIFLRMCAQTYAVTCQWVKVVSKIEARRVLQDISKPGNLRAALMCAGELQLDGSECLHGNDRPVPAEQKDPPGLWESAGLGASGGCEGGMIAALGFAALAEGSPFWPSCRRGHAGLE